MQIENNIKYHIKQLEYYLHQLFNNNIKNKNIQLYDVYPLDGIDIKPSSPLIKTKDLYDHIGVIYENHLKCTKKRDFGIFYTRDKTAISLLLKDVDILSGKILEPSCGTGMLLINIVKLIVIKLKQANYNSESILDYIWNNLHANDIDSIALKITELNVIFELLPLLIDAVNKNNSYKILKLKLFNYDYILKNGFKCKYSLIIGNPPFITMYGRRSRNMTEEKRMYYNSFEFVQNKKNNNKFNSSMFFIENSLHNLKKNGRLIFILDITFFENAFKDIRKYIIQNYRINRIIKGLKISKQVSSSQCIIDISNQQSTNNDTIIIDTQSNQKYIIQQKIWNTNENYEINIPINKSELNILNKIELFPKLESYFPNKELRTCCALTGKTDEFIVDINTKNRDDLIFPYIEGSKGLSEQFGKLYHNKYIKYDYNLQISLSNEFKQELSKIGVKNKKRVTLGDKASYLSPKIFIRQSANQIIATYTDIPYAANNSIYILTNKINTYENQIFLKYICGILNSKLITYYCLSKKIIKKEYGTTPQIRLSGLKKIRINIDDKHFTSIVNLVDILLDTPKNSEAKYQLNEIIYDIYDIDIYERNLIDKQLQKNHYIT